MNILTLYKSETTPLIDFNPFSGKLLINGLMDGILAVYFVASILITYKISTTKVVSEKTGPLQPLVIKSTIVPYGEINLKSTIPI